MCPKHYAVDVNVKSYPLRFNNTKSARLDFDRTFKRVPTVNPTMNDTGNVPPYKQIVTKTHCIIRFKSNFNGEVSVLVMEA